MGLLDFTSKVITTYKADTSDQKAKIRDLKGEEKALAKQQLDAAEARNKSLEDWILKLGKVGLAIGAVAGAAKLAWDGYQLGLKEARLQTAAAGVDIDKLSQAAGGLQTRFQLLQFAAKASQGAFHLNQQQMILLEKAMRTLVERGYDATQVQKAFADAVSGKSVSALQEFGIVLDLSSASVDKNGKHLSTLGQHQKLINELFRQMTPLAQQAGNAQLDNAEAGQRAAVSLRDSWDKLRIGLGQLVNAMAPLLNALASAVGLVGELAQAVATRNSYVDPQTGLTPGALPNIAYIVRQYQQAANLHPLDFSRYGAEIKQRAQGALSAKAIADVLRGAHSAFGLFNNLDNDPWLKGQVSGAITSFLKHMKDDYDKSHTTDAIRHAVEAQATAILHSGTIEATRNVGITGRNPGRQFSLALGAAANENTPAQQSAALGKMLDDFYRAQKLAEEAENTSLVQRMFGPIDEIHGYKDAFGALTDAVGAGYEAMVTGSESFGKAFKQAIGGALLAEGKKMQVLALENLAYGLAALALGPIGGHSAGFYFASAAAFEAGAVAAGLASHALGAGSAPSGGVAAPTPASNPGASSGSTGNGKTAIIVVGGDTFDGDSPYMRQLKARRAAEAAFGPDGLGVAA